MKRRLPSFTLIELLVVVSIIALLIAILLPSLRKARDQAKLTVCMSNLKEIGLGFGFYGDDHRQQPPPNRLFQGTPPAFRDSDWWYYAHMVPKHIPPDKHSATNAAFGGVFRCPSDKVAGRAYSMNIFASNYDRSKPGATQYTPDSGKPFNPFAVKGPQRYLLVGEAHAVFADYRNPGLFGTRYVIGQGRSHDDLSVYTKFRKTKEEAQRGPFFGYIDFSKHRARANFLCCDLHVETLKLLQVVTKDETDPSKWISTLRVQWSPLDPTKNIPTPQ